MKRMGRRGGVITSCACFGAAYGAVFGCFCGPQFLESSWLLPDVLLGTGVGLLLGAIGGGIAGGGGDIVGGRIGWSLAGALGGLAPATCLAFATLAAAFGNCSGPDWVNSFLLVASGVVLLGGLL